MISGTSKETPGQVSYSLSELIVSVLTPEVFKPRLTNRSEDGSHHDSKTFKCGGSSVEGSKRMMVMVSSVEFDWSTLEPTNRYGKPRNGEYQDVDEYGLHQEGRDGEVGKLGKLWTLSSFQFPKARTACPPASLT